MFMLLKDTLAERSKAVAHGAIRKGRGFEPHSWQMCQSTGQVASMNANPQSIVDSSASLIECLTANNESSDDIHMQRLLPL